MKRTMLVALILATALIAAGTAQAEFLSYNPSYQASPAENGKAVFVPLTVTVNGLAGTAGVTFIDSVSGNLPASWLSASPGTIDVSANMPYARTTLSITIPSNAVPGTYSGFIISSASSSSNEVDSGRGTYISVTVAEPAPVCPQSPDIEVSTVVPNDVNVTNNRPVDVNITGMISNPDGCSEEALTYQLIDEYGINDTSGSFTAGTDGSFNIIVPVKAARLGKDKDGREYKITLSAQNETGISNRTVSVNVLHDRR